MPKTYNKTPKKTIKQDIEKYIETNDLRGSHIPYSFLYQVRGTIPERKEIGRTESGKYVFLEETKHSLLTRHYGYNENQKQCFNIVITNKEQQGKVIKDYDEFYKISYQKDEITFNKNYDMEYIKKFYGINKIIRKQYNFNLSEKEHTIVRKFVEKLKKIVEEKGEDVLDNIKN